MLQYRVLHSWSTYTRIQTTKRKQATIQVIYTGTALTYVIGVIQVCVSNIRHVTPLNNSYHLLVPKYPQIILNPLYTFQYIQCVWGIKIKQQQFPIKPENIAKGKLERGIEESILNQIIVEVKFVSSIELVRIDLLHSDRADCTEF